jgi:hypothetical protein
MTYFEFHMFVYFLCTETRTGEEDLALTHREIKIHGGQLTLDAGVMSEVSDSQTVETAAVRVPI